MAKALIQMALDSLDFDQTRALAEQVASYVDSLEVGTPCIKYNSLEIVTALKTTYPNYLVLVDLKAKDGSEYEAPPFYAARADICTVLGVSDKATMGDVI